MPKSLVPNTFDYSGVYVEGKRSNLRFHKPHAASFMSGMLVPLGDPIPVFPGTRLDLKLAATIRSDTLLIPPLDGMYLDVFCVWVPHRIVFTNMPQFLGENDQTAWTQSVQTVYPTVYYQDLSNTIYSLITDATIQGDVVAANHFLAVHYGLIANATITSGMAIYNKLVNTLAIRGYYAIWNHFFRDENYQRPVLFSKGTSGSAGEFGYLLRDYKVAANINLTTKLNKAVDASMAHVNAVLMPVNKFHDWATSLLPEPQFGDASTILGASPILADIGEGNVFANNTKYVFGLIGKGSRIGNMKTAGFIGQPQINEFDAGDPESSNLGYADLGDVSVYADTSLTINQLRYAVMYQRYLEALARGGRRVVEYYDSIYNVKNSDAAKDYPQMLSHNRYILGVNQVVATADGSGSGWTSKLGDTGAYSLTQLKDIPLCMSEFSEFGYVHILYCVRADNRYSQATPEHFFRKELLNEYNPYFDHMGDIDVPNYLVNNIASSAHNFGFQEAWWFERTQVGLAVGALNKAYGSLGFWVLGEVFPNSLTTCTPGYLCFAPEVLNDSFANAYYSYPQFIIDSLIYGMKAGRISQHSIPGITGRI